MTGEELNAGKTKEAESIYNQSGDTQITEEEWKAREQELAEKAETETKTEGKTDEDDFAREYALIGEQGYRGMGRKIMLENLLKRIKREGGDEDQDLRGKILAEVKELGVRHADETEEARINLRGRDAELLERLGLDMEIKGKIKYELEKNAVKIDWQKNKSLEKIFDRLGLSPEEREMVAGNMELTLNGILDAEAEREFSRLWKYHKKVLAAGLGVGAIAGACSAGARILGIKAASGLLLKAGKVAGGAMLGTGAGLLRDRVRTWMNPAIDKIKRNNAKKLEKIREKKSREFFTPDNLRTVVTQEVRRAALDKFMQGKKWQKVSAYKTSAMRFIAKQENMKDLAPEQKKKLANSIAVLVEVMNENSRRLGEIIDGRTRPGMNATAKSMIQGGLIGGAVGIAQSIADSPYMPAIAGGAIGGVAIGKALDTFWEKKEMEKKSAEIVDEIEAMEQKLKQPDQILADEEISQLKSCLESGVLDKYPMARAKAKKILIEESLKGMRGFDREKISGENEKLAKKFKRSVGKKALSYAAGIGGGVIAGVAGRYAFEGARHLLGIEGAEHLAGGGKPRDGWQKIFAELKAERTKYGLPATDKRLEEIAKFSPRIDKEMELLHKAGPHGLLQTALREAARREAAGGKTVVPPAGTRAGTPMAGPHTPYENPMAGKSETEVLAEAKNMDRMMGEEAAQHQREILQAGVAAEDAHKTRIAEEIAGTHEQANVATEDAVKSRIAEEITKMHSAAAEVRIEGKTDTFSEAIDKTVGKADIETQENFIHKVLGDGTKISSPEARHELLSQAVRKLSVANIKTGDGNDVANLVYKGNIVRLHHDGSWEVLKGGGVKEASAVSELSLRQEAAKEWARDLGLDPEKVRYAGDAAHLDNRSIITEIEGHEVTLRQDGYYETKIGDHSISGNIDKGQGVSGIADDIRDIEKDLMYKNIAEQRTVFENSVKTTIDGYTKLGVSEETMRGVGINPSDGFSLEEKKTLDFLVSHSGNLERATEAVRMAGSAHIAPGDAFDYYYQLKGVAGNPDRMRGVLLLLKENNQAGLRKIFGVDVDDHNYGFKDGIHRIKDIARGFDLAVRVDGGEIKFGVDGPWGKWNWGAGGRSWRSHIDADLTNTNIEEAKAEIARMAKSIGSAGKNRVGQEAVEATTAGNIREEVIPGMKR